MPETTSPAAEEGTLKQTPSNERSLFCHQVSLEHSASIATAACGPKCPLLPPFVLSEGDFCTLNVNDRDRDAGYIFRGVRQGREVIYLSRVAGYEPCQLCSTLAQLLLVI